MRVPPHQDWVTKLLYMKECVIGQNISVSGAYMPKQEDDIDFVGARILFFLSVLFFFFSLFLGKPLCILVYLSCFCVWVEMGNLGSRMFENRLFSLIDLCNVM